MARTRLTSSGLNTGGSFCGSLRCQISAARSWATQRDAEQEAHPGHDPVAVADAGPALDEVQLEAAHLVGRRRVGRAFEPSGEPLAAIDVAALRVRIELARSHVFDHSLTQRTDGVGLAHESSILSEVHNTSILRTG